MHRGSRSSSELTHSGDETDTKSSKEATCDEQGLACGDGLQNNTEVEDESNCRHETNPATENIGTWSREECTEECTCRQNGHNKGVLARRELSVRLCCESLLPVFHA
jgi:hypothetical protein